MFFGSQLKGCSELQDLEGSVGSTTSYVNTHTYCCAWPICRKVFCHQSSFVDAVQTRLPRSKAIFRLRNLTFVKVVPPLSKPGFDMLRRIKKIVPTFRYPFTPSRLRVLVPLLIRWWRAIPDRAGCPPHVACGDRLIRRCTALVAHAKASAPAGRKQ